MAGLWESALLPASDNGPWKGVSGRSYSLQGTDRGREGGMATIRTVVAQGAPVGESQIPAGTKLALKLARASDPLARESLIKEVEIFQVLCRSPGQAPCPRAYDTIGNPVTGLVMEWCPSDMERWWIDNWRQPRSFIAICEAMADLCRRVREYAAILELDLGKKVIHADIKPRNVLRSVDGRWLLTDFGASKARPIEEENWAATRMILGTENYIAPEALFNACKPQPAAMDTWAIACTFFALLRMRSYLSSGAAMPINGTHAHHFRTHRVALVSDLQERRPTLFVNKELDPAAFTSPDKLPDRDRQAVIEGCMGIFGSPNPSLERILANDVLKVLDRALSIAPSARYTDPLELASDFEGLAERFREIEAKVAASGPKGKSEPKPEPKAAAIEADDPTRRMPQSPLFGENQQNSGGRGAFPPPPPPALY